MRNDGSRLSLNCCPSHQYATIFDTRDDESVPSNLLQRLQRAGAPETCYHLSLYKVGTPSDEEELSLDEALASRHLYGGTLISCIPGILVMLDGDVRGDNFLFMKGEPNKTLQPPRRAQR
jgi:hypothetical protein